MRYLHPHEFGFPTASVWEGLTMEAAGIRRQAGDVSRTNIDLPDEIVDEVMRAFDLPT